MNMPVNVTIKNKGGRIVKDFSVSGPHGVERILLWIWRDLFLSLLARGLSSDKKKTAEMLESVEFMLDWTALERLLYGGKQCELFDMILCQQPDLLYLYSIVWGQ